MTDKDVVSMLVSALEKQLDAQTAHHAKVEQSLQEQNQINKETATALGNLAHQIERSNDRHDLNDSRILDLENAVDYMKPVVQRSEWWQMALGDVVKKFIIPAVVLGVLAAAGYQFYPDSNHKKQESSQNGN